MTDRLGVGVRQSLDSRDVPGTRGCWLWPSWFIALLVVSGVQMATLTITPLNGKDGAQIVECGRVLLDSRSDWSFNWSPQNRPLPPSLSYVGPAIQECAFRLFSGTASAFWPRLFSLAGALVAATLALGWLLARSTKPLFAWLLSMAFLLDPNFVEGYRGARVDGWALALCFGAAWLLTKRDNEVRPAWADFTAGAMAGTAFMVWPTSPILYPLLMVQFASSHYTRSASHRGYGLVVSRAAIAALGGGIAVALLLIPVRNQLPAILGALHWHYATNLELGHTHDPFSINAARYLSVFALSPFIPLLAIPSVLHSKNRLLGIATLVCMILLLGTRVDVNRVVYILPYLLGLASSNFAASELPGGRRYFRHALTAVLMCALLWCVGLSLVVRTLNAWPLRSSRDPQSLVRAGTDEIGRGPYRVFVQPYEFYYAGRRLGWRMYHPVGGADIKSDESRRLLREVDYALLTVTPDSEDLKVLTESGLERKSVLLSQQKQAPVRLLGVTVSSSGAVYGPYTLYARRVHSGGE